MARSGKNKRFKKAQRPQQYDKNERARKSLAQHEQEEAADSEQICWHIGKFDFDGPWGIDAISGVNFRNIVSQTISSWETMTWAELFSATGGRKVGNNNHPVEVSRISTAAKKRLKEIRLDDVGTIVSLRVSSKVRIYGIRRGRFFQFLWFDPWHDDREKAVYPTSR